VHLLGPAAARRQHHYRHRHARVAPLAQQRQTVHPGQPEVEQHGVIIFGARQVVGAVAGRGPIDGIAGTLEGRLELRGEGGFVLDDQDSHPSLIARVGLNGT